MSTHPIFIYERQRRWLENCVLGTANLARTGKPKYSHISVESVIGKLFPLDCSHNAGLVNTS